MKNTGVLKRIVSMALLAVMMLSLLPVATAETAAAAERYGYIVINNDSKDRRVNLRPKPGSTDYLDKLDEWLVVQIYSTSTSGGKTWYRASKPGVKQYGYIQGDFVQEMTAEEIAAWAAGTSPYFGKPVEVTATPTVSPTPGPDATEPVLPEAGEPMGYVVLILDKVNVYAAPGGAVLTASDADKLAVNQILVYYNVVVNVGGYNWAQVVYGDGKIGYIRSDCYAFSDMDGNVVTQTAPGAATTTNPPSTVPDIPEGAYGVTNTDKVMFRKTMSTSGDYWARLPWGWRVNVLSAQIKGGILWYKVQGGTPNNPDRTYTGYIHGSYLNVFNPNAPTATPTGSVSQATYGLILTDGANLRATPGGTSLGALQQGTVVNVFTVPGATTEMDYYYIGVPWNNEQGYLYGYISASYMRVLGAEELAGVGPLPAAPTASPSPSPTPSMTGSGYIRLILDKVNIRKEPSGTSLTPKDQDKLRVNTVLAYFEGPVYNGGYNWVKVTYGKLTGYIRSDCYEFCDKDGNPVTVQPTDAPTQAPGVTGQTYIRLTMNNVNLRVAPWDESIVQLSKGTVLPYTDIRVAESDGTRWYHVYSSTVGGYGYILSTMAVTCDAFGNEVTAPTVQPGATTTPAPGGTQPGNTGYTGYIATNIKNVFVRTAPFVGAESMGQIKDKGTVLPLSGVAVYNSPYTWYPVRLSDGTYGYIRGDCAFELAQWQLDEYNKTGTVPSPTPGPATPKPGNSDYVRVTGNGKLNVRETPSTKAEQRGQYSPGDIVRFYEKKTVGNVTWYRVAAPKGGYGWIHGGYCYVLTNAEYEETKPTVAPTAVPTAMPDPSTFSDVAFTNTDRVKIRAQASMSGKELTMVYDEGTQLTYLGNYTAPTASNPYYWFNVRYQNISGWMRGEYIRILTKAEKQAYELTGNPDSPPEASYTTLRPGDRNDEVTRLQQKLVEKGYLTQANVTGVYDSATEEAVRKFQKDNSLSVDGVAGEQTQHKLYNTVPQGTYTDGSVTPTIFPVERVDWYTGDIQQVWSVGTVAIITDVRTGISFRAQRLYGGSHADCEPLTTADTDAYCRIYGTSTAQEIADRDSEMQNWRRRPLWVTIGNRTFAASLYGVPHNFDGDRIPDNNFPGQFCVHFVNSRTHAGDRVDYDSSVNGNYGHQHAIQDAYDAYWSAQ